MFRCVIVLHDVAHGPTDKWKAGLFGFWFLSKRYGRYDDPKKVKSAHNFCKKIMETKTAFRLCAHAVQIRR